MKAADLVADLTVHEVAEVLRVSDETVRRLARTGALRAYRIGSRLRVSPEAVEDYRAAQKEPDPWVRSGGSR